MMRNEEPEERTERPERKHYSGHNKVKNRVDILGRAKKLVMERYNLSESEAHRYIQKRAMDSGTDLIEMSEMVIMLYGEEQ